MAYNVISCKKKSKETLKKSKSLILQCKFGSRAQKWPKIAKKTDHLIAIYSIFCIGMVYLGCLQDDPFLTFDAKTPCLAFVGFIFPIPDARMPQFVLPWPSHLFEQSLCQSQLINFLKPLFTFDWTLISTPYILHIPEKVWRVHSIQRLLDFVQMSLK